MVQNSINNAMMGIKIMEMDALQNVRNNKGGNAWAVPLRHQTNAKKSN